MAGEGLLGMLSSFSSHFSYVELLWVSLSGSYVVVGLYEALTDDGRSCNEEFTGASGLLRFKKRPAKRWFLAAGINSIFVYSMLRAYFSGVPAFNWVFSVLEHASTADTILSDHLSVFLASGMLTLHLLQKLHQSVFVNVHGSPSQGPLDFVSPFLYAGAVSITLFSQAPPFFASPDPVFSWSLFKWRHLLGGLLFLWSTYQDHAVQPALSNTRRNRAGHIVTIDHKAPKGGLYEIVSCPSFLLTAVTHVAIGITLGFTHRAWMLCAGYVAVSHIVRALRRQRWYVLKFRDVAMLRKAIIPYIL